ncbi:MAG: ABC transporter substrate-binding protein, partial [Pseudomonadota bacterium]
MKTAPRFPPPSARAMRTRMPRVVLAVLLAFLMLPAACGMAGDEGEDAPVRIVWISGDGAGAVGMAGLDEYLTAAQHLGLTARAADGRIVPGLASSWRVLDDGRTYVFKLREARWPDDRRITAGDVVAVMQRQIAPGGTTPLIPYLFDVAEAKGVAANRKPPRMLGVDNPREDVVTITLDRPQPALLAMLAHPSLAIVRRDDPPPPSGAYRSADEETALVPNPAYYERDLAPPAPIMLLETDVTTALARFRRGEADIVTGAATDGLSASAGDEFLAARRIEATLGLYGYLARTGSGPLADTRIRRALAMTVPREDIAAAYNLVPAMQPAYGPLAPTLPEPYAGATPDWTLWTPAIRFAEATRLLAEAGHAPDAPLTLDVALPQGRDHEAILTAIARVWAPL